MPDADGPVVKRAETLAEFRGVVAFDIPRVWANGFGGLKSEGFFILVAKEGIIIEAEGQQETVERNVASMVMPEQVAITLRDLLNTNFPVQE